MTENTDALDASFSPKTAAKKRGRPKTGQGKTQYVPARYLSIIEALESKNKDLALKLVEIYFKSL